MNTNILFTDIVGYSKLTGRDQSLALELLTEHDKIIEPIIKKYNGNIVKRIGDAIVAIFKNTNSMIQTSIEIQQSLKNRNNRNLKSRELVLRIGLHYGEITLQDNEIYGIGYDLASEIEPICQFGEIAISQAVYEQVNQHNELIVEGVENNFFINPIAYFQFKSSNKPLLVYKLYLNLLDWYDELYTQLPDYLLDQHVSSNIYDIKNIYSFNSKKLTQKLDLGNQFLQKHNLSHAVYFYKKYLNDSNKPNIEIELLILKIFAECGLVRLINKAISKFNYENNLILLIEGINLFNQKNFDDSLIKFDSFLNEKPKHYLFDGLYYSIIILFNQKKYDAIIQRIKFHNSTILESKIHSYIFQNIQKIILSELNDNNNQKQKLAFNLDDKLSTYISSLDLLDQKYTLFLYYIFIQFSQKYSKAEQAINIQNQAISIIKLCTSSISDFTLRLLFSKRSILHQLISERLELELEFVDHEGLDDYDFDDIVTEQYNFDDDITNKNKQGIQFCNSCDSENSVQFKFCTTCGLKLVH